MSHLSRVTATLRESIGQTRKRVRNRRWFVKFALKCNLGFPFFQSHTKKEWQG